MGLRQTVSRMKNKMEHDLETVLMGICGSKGLRVDVRCMTNVDALEGPRLRGWGKQEPLTCY